MLGALAAAAALLLVGSGLAKLRSPAPVAQTLVALVPVLARRRRRLPALARVLGGAELAVGTAVLAVGGRVPFACLAASYLAFAAVAIRLRTGNRAVPCGCFGRVDAPVGAAHIVLNAVAAGVAAAAAAGSVGPLGGFLGPSAFVAAVGLTQVVLLAWLGYLAITALPALTGLTREV